LPGVLFRTVEAGDNRAGVLPPCLAREGIHRRYRLQTDEGAELLRGFRQEIAIGAHDALAMLGVPEDGPGIHHLHRMSLEEETCPHPEISTAAAECPEQVGVLFLAGSDESSVGEDDVCLEEIVDREAVFAREIARSTAEGQSRYPGRGDYS